MKFANQERLLFDIGRLGVSNKDFWVNQSLNDLKKTIQAKNNFLCPCQFSR